MTRHVLPERRANITAKVHVEMDGNVKDILITIGFDNDGKPREVFCADFKAGTSIHAIVMDACILFSRLLQHDDTPSDLLSSMCQPHSLIGMIAATVAQYEKEVVAS